MKAVSFLETSGVTHLNKLRHIPQGPNPHFSNSFSFLQDKRKQAAHFPL